MVGWSCSVEWMEHATSGGQTSGSVPWAPQGACSYPVLGMPVKNMYLMGKSKEKKQIRVRLRGREFGCVVSSPTNLSSYARVISIFFILSEDIYTMCPWELEHGCNITTVAQSTNSNASFSTVFLGILGFYILNGTHSWTWIVTAWQKGEGAILPMCLLPILAKIKMNTVLLYMEW